jgi:hypothetical protein
MNSNDSPYYISPEAAETALRLGAQVFCRKESFNSLISFPRDARLIVQNPSNQEFSIYTWSSECELFNRPAVLANASLYNRNFQRLVCNCGYTDFTTINPFELQQLHKQSEQSEQ